MPARDMAAYMRERRARQKAEKVAIEQRGGTPVFTTHSSGEFGYRDGTKSRPAAACPRPDRGPSPSRALVVRQATPAPARESMIAGIAGGRRVPAGYDAGTYPIPAPYRPDAMPSQLMHAICTVEARRQADRAELEALKARVEKLEADRRGPLMTLDWGNSACRFVILMNGLAEHGRAQDAARRGVKAG